jgi:hypothetical protein
MLIARRFKRATTSETGKVKEKLFWLYTFVWSLLFNIPVMLINYLNLHDYPDISATFHDSNIDNFDFCYYSSSRWAFLFNVICLIFPCLLALSYNVYCFKSGLQASREAASTLVLDRETRNTRRYLGALVVVWVPTIIMNLLRYFSLMTTYTFINIIVILTSMQGILHTVAYVMSYRPLRRYIKHTLCNPFCQTGQFSSPLQDTLIHKDDDEDEITSPLAAYDIHTYRSPIRSSISGKSGHRSEDIFDRTCSAENFVKFGEVQYQIMESPAKYSDEYDEDEARDSFNDKEILTPMKETKGWKKLVRKLTPPIDSFHFGHSSGSSHSGSPFSPKSRFSPEHMREEEQAYLTDYYHHLFHQAHESHT